MTTPTFTELYESIRDELKDKLGLSSLVGKTFLNAFALVQAGKLKVLYLLAGSIYKNIFVDTADADMLSRFGFVKLNRYPNEATAGEYTAEVTGTPGAVIAAGTTFKSLDSSTSPAKLFVLDASYTMPASTGAVSLRALDLGTTARLEIGDQVQVTQPIAALDSFAEILSVDITATEAETLEAYRVKVIAAYQTEPQGGAKTDFRLWALDAAGVRDTYPYVVDGEPNTLDMFVEATPDNSTDGRGTPSAAALLDVEEVVEYDPDTTKPDSERGRRPVTAWKTNYLPIITAPVDVQVVGLTDAGFLTQIADAITAKLYYIRPFIGGADNPGLLNKGRLYSADLTVIARDVIGVAASFDNLIMQVDSVAVNSYEFDEGRIPYLASVT